MLDDANLNPDFLLLRRALYSLKQVVSSADDSGRKLIAECEDRLERFYPIHAVLSSDAIPPYTCPDCGGGVHFLCETLLCTTTDVDGRTGQLIWGSEQYAPDYYDPSFEVKKWAIVCP